MSRASKIGLLFAVFLGIAVGRAPELLADTLVLKDGRTIETTILNEETDYIEVERHGASMLYLTEQIERIERSGSEAEQVVVGVSPSAQSPMAAEAADSGTSDGPEAAYRAYLESFKQGDVDGTRQRVAKEGMEAWEQTYGNLTSAVMKQMSPMIPTNIVFDDLNIEGDRAVLTGTADAFLGPSKGSVTMAREGGRWKYVKEVWSSAPVKAGAAPPAAATGAASAVSTYDESDPEGAYHAYVAAFKNGDIEGVRQRTARAGLETWQEDFGDMTPELMKQMSVLMPAGIVFTSVDIQGDTAALTGSSETFMGKMQGSVTLVREQGSWKYLKEEWSGSEKSEGGETTFSFSSDPTQPRKEDTGYDRFGSIEEGEASVSGSVRLFKEPNETGYLRIQFSTKKGMGYFGVDLEDKVFTDGRANYTIDGVTPGDYSATAWYIVSEPDNALNVHGARQEVTLEPGDLNAVDFVVDQRY